MKMTRHVSDDVSVMVILIGCDDDAVSRYLIINTRDCCNKNKTGDHDGHD